MTQVVLVRRWKDMLLLWPNVRHRDSEAGLTRLREPSRWQRSVWLMSRRTITDRAQTIPLTSLAFAVHENSSPQAWYSGSYNPFYAVPKYKERPWRRRYEQVSNTKLTLSSVSQPH